jgi:hypothetical protein
MLAKSYRNVRWSYIAHISKSRNIIFQNMSLLHQQIQESVHELESIRECIKYAEALSLRLAEEEHALRLLEDKLTREQRDVNVLERESVTTLIRKIIGDREEKLEKEKEEYVNVSGRHIELHKSIELIRYELGLLKGKADSLESLELKVDILLREREKELVLTDPVTATLLKALDEESMKYNVYLKTVEKIKATGNSALTLVTSIENHMNEAREQLVSNKAGSALLVDDALDNARRPLQKANQLLARFQKELKSVFSEINLDTHIRLEKIGRYSDFIVVSDLSFKEKINTSRRRVRDIREQVEFYLSLLQENNETLGKLAEIEEERKRIILNAVSAPNP